MGAALQQIQARRPQQELVHHQAPQQRTPTRSVTEAPGEEEYLEGLGNGSRCAALGLGGAPSDGSPPGGMAACREAAAADPAQVSAADFGAALQGSEETLLALGESCVDAVAEFEDASNRWYHLGAGREAYEQERSLYLHDLRLYQALALRARADGAIVESTYRLVDEALREAEATHLLLVGEKLAGESAGGALMLDPEDMERDLGLVEEAFAVSGFAATEGDLLAELDEGPGELMERLEVEVHGFSAALAHMRAGSVARRAEAVGEEKQQIEAVIATCDRLGEVMRLCVASYRLGLAAAGADLGATAEGAGELLGGPHEIPGAIARAFYEAELHALTARLTALSAAEEGWEAAAHTEEIRDALGEYTLTVQAIDEYEQSAPRRRDEYVARLGNLGRTMGLAASLQGRGLAGDAGRAMENLARVQVCHRSLAAVGAPLEAAIQRCLQSGGVLRAASSQRPPQASLVAMRARLAGPADFYYSVYQGLNGLQGQVNQRRGSLEDISERFGDIMQRQRR
jgi:hypothetical protein